MDDDRRDRELDGIRNKEHLTMVDRIRGQFHASIDRNDAGQVIYPRRDYLQNQADQRRREADEAKKRGGG